jgi:tetratricopeptide (TPR) repeat protein
MKLHKSFGKRDNPKHAPAARMSPFLRAMAAEIPRWPPEKRPLMEKIVIEANAAGVTSMEELSKFLNEHPDLQAGFYATMSGGFGARGTQTSTQETFEEPPTPGNTTMSVTIDGETIELSSEAFAVHPEKSIKVNTVLLEDVRRRGDRYGEAVVLGELGIAHARLNQLQKAIYYFERHLEIASELGNWEWEMEDYRNIGRAHLELGDYEHAGATYEKALQLARGRNDRRWDIEHSLYLASVYAGQGKIELAAELRNHAMALRNRGAI